jgi:hypothetical protein
LFLAFRQRAQVLHDDFVNEIITQKVDDGPSIDFTVINQQYKGFNFMKHLFDGDTIETNQ